MRLLSSARCGTKWAEPASKPLAAIVPRRSPRNVRKTKLGQPGTLGRLVHEWASSQRLATDVQWMILADSEIRTLTSVAAAVALGVPRDVAPRIVAKIAGLVANE